MRHVAWICLLCVLPVGCDGDDPPPPPPRDAGERMDAGPLIPPPRRDAGPRLPMIDGVVTDDEWTGAESAEASEPTDSAGSELTRLRVILDDDALSVAVEGTLATGDTLVVYVDRALDEGVGVTDLSTIDDTDVALDAALSGGPTTPSTFAADFAFGTNTMPAAVVGLDPTAGWRELSDPEDLTWIAGEDGLLVCGDDACEAQLPRSMLGGAPPRTIAVFARIVRSSGDLTNQTLPFDDPSTPSVVSELLTFAEDADVDAGMADAGVADAGPPAGLVVDGVLSPGEWDAATVVTQTVDATGSFAGNRLDTLRAIRQAGRVYLAVEVTLLAGNAVVIYLDHDLNGFDGLASPTPLIDNTGDLDRAISRPLFTPSELLLDFAWGTLDMNRAATSGDARMGWRDIATQPDDFLAINTGAAPTACGPSVCETSISLADLAVAPADTVAVFARLVSATSAGFSNQTLPVDDPAAPDFISVYLSLAP